MTKIKIWNSNSVDKGRMQKMSLKAIMSFSFIVMMLGFVSCKKQEQERSEKDENAIHDSIVKNVETEPAKIEDMAEIVKLNGKIVPDEAKQAKVFALVSGKVKSVFVELGDYVHKGQILAVINSVEAAGVTNELAVAESNVEIAKKNMESTKDLFNSNLATEKDYISSKLEYNKAISELNKAQAVFSITGSSKNGYELKAPIDGYVIEKNITNNSEVRPDNSSNLFTIADLSNVWLIANVFEADINSIHLGDEVTVHTLADPDKEYKGSIDKMYNVLDPNTRTMQVKITMKNTNNELKPEMFATIIAKGKSSGRMLAIPSKAVVLNNGKRYVVVKTGPKTLVIKEIQVVKRIGDKSFITGLEEGERVVTSSEVFLFESLNSK